MIHLILFSKVFIFSIWTWQTFACSKSIIRRKFEISSQLTIKTLERGIVLVSSFLILNSFHTLFFSCVSVANFEQVVPCREGWHHKQKASQKKSFLPFCNYWNLCCDVFSREWNKNGRHIVSTIPWYIVY